MNHTVTTTTVYAVTEDDGRCWEFRYNDSLTINVWACDDDGNPIAEVDVMTLGEPSHTEARTRVDEWLALISED